MKKYSLLQSNYVALLGPSQYAEQLLNELIQFEKDLAKVCSIIFLYLLHSGLKKKVLKNIAKS